jgi:hypothetical protein
MSVIKPLSNEKIKSLALSIYSESASTDVSHKYSFVPTYTLLDRFRESGYYPIMCSESKVRDMENNGYL